jgi:hypothetical protein
MLRINAAVVLAASLLAGAAQGATRGADVPNFNISSACDALARMPEARMVDTTQPDSTKHCVEAESEARDQLVKQWSRFNAADRSMCVGVSSAGSVDPVYTELMTCLEMARDSRQLTDRNAQAAPANAPNSQQSAQNQH